MRTARCNGAKSIDFGTRPQPWGNQPVRQIVLAREETKIPRYQDTKILVSWYLGILVSSRARTICLTGWFPHGWGRVPKSMLLAPLQRAVRISRKYSIYYTGAMISWCQPHQNIDVLVPQITHKAAKQLSWCQSWCQDSNKLVTR